MGEKKDDGKLRWDLMPWECLNPIVKVWMIGANKYTDFGWQTVPDAKRRYFAAAQRHILAWWSGESEDSESKITHLAHAVCCLLILMWHDKKGVV